MTTEHYEMIMKKEWNKLKQINISNFRSKEDLSKNNVKEKKSLGRLRKVRGRNWYLLEKDDDDYYILLNLSTVYGRFYGLVQK